MTKQDSSENQAKLVYLAIGSNLGNKIQNIDKAKLELKTHNVKILKCSNNFESESWPDPSKPDFINIVIKAEVYCGALKLLEICKLVEKKLGRVKSKKNSPRKCDIDIIDYICIVFGRTPRSAIDFTNDLFLHFFNFIV